MNDSIEDLQNGLVLAELGGHGNGPYCAKHGAGAALVIMGTYVIDPSDNVPYPADFVFKPGRANYAEYLKEHAGAARDSAAKVGVSAISVKLDDTIDFFQACEQAGADYVSLCAYSVMEMFTSEGLGCELVRRKNHDKLREWACKILDAVSVPFIFKLGFIDEPDAIKAVDILSDVGVEIIHAVGESSPRSTGIRNLTKLARRCDFLIGGGGVTDVESAKRILSAGAQAVSVATAAMEDPTLLGRLQKQLRT